MTSPNASSYPIREAFQRFYPAYKSRHPVTEEQNKTAMCITNCKTGELGYNISICEECGTPLIHAVSCNNRSCPCCQAALVKKWEAERNTELIKGIAYYHVVFTVPHELNLLIYANMSVLLGLLFQSVHDTLLKLCADRKFMGAKPGIMSVLHTWGQKLTFHPHIHVCVSGGGITPSGTFVEKSHRSFFLPERVIAVRFRGHFLCVLKKLYESGSLDLTMTPELADPVIWQQFIDVLFNKRWLPFVKETFNGKGNAVRYLARYSYRTAIANSRIMSVDDESVTFRYKDYADKCAEKKLTVSGETFIGLFLQHILPSRFHRVRFAGYLTNSQKTKNLKLIHTLRNTVYPGNPFRSMHTAELIREFYGFDICSCRKCSGHMLQLPRGLPIERIPSFLKMLQISAE